jgi:glutaredoxin
MDKKYVKPYKTDYTIYTISNCKYCNLLCSDIKSKKYVINCDKYLLTLRERDNFYKYIHKYTIKPYIYFPMIFKDGVFIGGYKEYIERKSQK